MPQPISTNHTNLCTSETIWPHLQSPYHVSLQHSQSAPTMPTYAHRRQSDLIYSHRTMSAYSTANQHQPCKPYHIRDNLTSSTFTVPCQPRLQAISTNHANLSTSGTIWTHLQSPYHIGLFGSHQHQPYILTTYAVVRKNLQGSSCQKLIGHISNISEYFNLLQWKTKQDWWTNK